MELPSLNSLNCNTLIKRYRRPLDNKNSKVNFCFTSVQPSFVDKKKKLRNTRKKKKGGCIFF